MCPPEMLLFSSKCTVRTSLEFPSIRARISSSLHPEIGGLFADHMDIKSLCLWRATCKYNYAQATASLRRSLMKLLSPFLHTPSLLVNLVTEHHALFGGEIALAFILRDSTYLPRELEIYASKSSFPDLSDTILRRPNILCIQHTSETIHSEHYTLRRLITKTLHIRLTNGLNIHLHSSYNSSAVAGIARSFTTGLSNYVSGQGFACSHPVLTLHRRALLSDVILDAKSALDTRVMGNMVTWGFQFAVSPSTWPEYLICPDNTDIQSPLQCWRSLYMCPSQGRYFGDPGSFVNYFDLLAGDADLCVSRSLPPYGPMLAWRVMTTFPCTDDCDSYDPLVGDGVTSLPLLVTQNSLGRPKDVLVDRLLGTRRREDTGRTRTRSHSL